MCTLIVKEIIKHYMNNGSNVYMCCLDASQAFDKIRHDKLFEILIDRKIPPIDLRIVLDLYARQKVRTTWLGEISSAFGANNGIRQGGISSPILFCCYMDLLISRLRDKGIGCWIGEHFCASVAYADDLTLLSPTAEGLQMLIDECEDYGREFGMTYNPRKSVCTLFSRGKTPSVDIKLNGNPLPWHKDVKHLGNFISHDLSEQCEISAKKSDLIGRVNTLVGNAPKVIDRRIIMSIFRSQCCHFYGVQTWKLRGSHLKSFLTLWNRCVRRLCRLPPKTHCRFLPHIAEMQSPHDKICELFLGLYACMTKSDNVLVKFIATKGAGNMQTIIGDNLNYIRDYYGVTVSYLKLNSCVCSNEDFATIEAIKDIIDNRVLFAPDELLQFVNFLSYS